MIENPFGLPGYAYALVLLIQTGMKTFVLVRKRLRSYPMTLLVCGPYNMDLLSFHTFYILSVSGERPHKCDLCDRAFTTRGNLRTHYSSVHRQQLRPSPPQGGSATRSGVMQCPLCLSRFMDQQSMQQHMQMHLYMQTQHLQQQQQQHSKSYKNLRFYNNVETSPAAILQMIHYYELTTRFVLIVKVFCH